MSNNILELSRSSPRHESSVNVLNPLASDEFRFFDDRSAIDRAFPSFSPVPSPVVPFLPEQQQNAINQQGSSAAFQSLADSSSPLGQSGERFPSQLNILNQSVSDSNRAIPASPLGTIPFAPGDPRNALYARLRGIPQPQEQARERLSPLSSSSSLPSSPLLPPPASPPLAPSPVPSQQSFYDIGDIGTNVSNKEFNQILQQPRFLESLANTPGRLCELVQTMSLAKCDIFVRQCTRPHYDKDRHGELPLPPNPKLLKLITPPTLVVCQISQENILHCAARNVARKPNQPDRTRPDETVYAQLHNLLLRELTKKTKGERNKYNKYKFFRCIVMQPNRFRRSTLGEAICASHKFHLGDRLVEEFIFEQYASPRKYKHELKICWSNCTRLACGSDRRQSTFEVAAMVNAYDLFCKYFDLLERLRDFHTQTKSHTQARVFEACKQNAPTTIPEQNKPQPCLEAYVETAPECFEDCDQESKQIMHEFFNDSYPTRSKIRGYEDLKTPIFVTHNMALFYSIRMALANAIHMNHYEFVVNLAVGYERYYLHDVFVKQELAPLQQLVNGQLVDLFPFSDKDKKLLWRKMLGIYSKTHKFYNENPEPGDLLEMFVKVLVQDSRIPQITDFYKHPFLSARSAALCNLINNSDFCDELDRRGRQYDSTTPTATMLDDFKNFREEWTKKRKQPISWQCNQHQIEIQSMLANTIFADTRQKTIVHLLLLYIFKGDEEALKTLNLVSFAMDRMKNNSPLTPDEAKRKNTLISQIPMALMFFGLFSDPSYIPLFFVLFGDKNEWLDRYRYYYFRYEGMYQVPLRPVLRRSYRTYENQNDREILFRRQRRVDVEVEQGQLRVLPESHPLHLPPGVNVIQPFASPLWYATISGRVDLIKEALSHAGFHRLPQEEQEVAICQLFFLDPIASEISYINPNTEEIFWARENTLSLLYAAFSTRQLSCFAYLLASLSFLRQWHDMLPPSFPNPSEMSYFDPRALLGLITEFTDTSQLGMSSNTAQTQTEMGGVMLFLYLLSLAQYLFVWQPYQGRRDWRYQDEFQRLDRIFQISLPKQIIDQFNVWFTRARTNNDTNRYKLLLETQQGILIHFAKKLFDKTYSKTTTFQEAFNMMSEL